MGECLRVHNAAIRREAKLHLRQKLKVLVAMKDEKKKSADKTSTTTSTNAMSTDATQSSETSTARKKRKSKGAKKSGTNTVIGETYNNNQHKMTARKEESANRLLQMFRHGVHHNVLTDDT
jgi:hypothetical protein